MTKKIMVKKVFAIEDEHCLLVHLDSFDWDFRSYGPVSIGCENQWIRARFIAGGNVEGDPVVRLVLSEEGFGALEEIAQRLTELTAKGVFLVRE